MKLKAVLAGTAQAIADIAATPDACAQFDLRGAAVIGPGSAEIGVLVRAAAWSGLDLAALQTKLRNYTKMLADMAGVEFQRAAIVPLASGPVPLEKAAHKPE